MSEDKNIVWHKQSVTREIRENANGHKGCILWYTGLSGSGKSTVANEVEKKLLDLGAKSYLLDGDNVRHGLNSDLGFTKEDRAGRNSSRRRQAAFPGCRQTKTSGEASRPNCGAA